AVDADAGTPDHGRVAHGCAPFGTVAQVGIWLSAVHDHREVLAREREIGPGPLTAGPRDDVELSGTGADERRESGTHGLEQVAAGEEAAARGRGLEGTVEPRKQPPALRGG